MIVGLLALEGAVLTLLRPSFGVLFVLAMAGVGLLVWASIAVHELGHLVAGWWGGGRFLMWSAGPVLIHRSPDRLVFRWNTVINPLGGTCAVVRPDRGRSLREWQLFLVAGGVANLVFAALLALAPTTGLFTVVAWIGAAASTLMGLVNLAPRVRGSDGHLLRSLLRGDDASRRLLALDAISSRLLSGARIGDLPSEGFEDLPGPPDGTYVELAARYTRAGRRSAAGDEAGAWEDFVAVVAAAPPPVPLLPIRAYACCAASQLLAQHQPPLLDLSRQWLDAAGELSFDPGYRTLSRAILADAEGNREEARSLARVAYHELRRHSMGFEVPADLRDAIRALDPEAAP